MRAKRGYIFQDSDSSCNAISKECFNEMGRKHLAIFTLFKAEVGNSLYWRVSPPHKHVKFLEELFLGLGRLLLSAVGAPVFLNFPLCRLHVCLGGEKKSLLEGASVKLCRLSVTKRA